MKTCAPILKYPGAKWRIGDWIISHIPKHEVYCELFFGSGAVFFNKTPARIETVNDLNGDVVNFFKVLREDGEKLAELISLTPWAREEYYNAYSPSDTDIERARKYAVRCSMSFGASNLYKNGFRTGIAPTAPNPPGVWARMPELIISAMERLRNTQIENLPAVELLKKYNDPKTLIYADPPYLLSTRKKQKVYKHEMSEADHAELLEALAGSRSKIILSGYETMSFTIPR